ncbi:MULTISPECIES: MerR family transcriptional regulator [unclassified Pseudoalteromonas]|uniref:MerR family transcriptional regulator n=1 Tax=unclassified Pseudoalteromonas TaxID=194690 RepID=UPI0025B51268|nr:MULTISPECIES: MerR family transcriptional regulator [unclassified Pseudoalteromonas]MDN3379497.1 MerR family transcriptional regulator [Pseudoalteromonas sp. APC 3893]MDN3387837.1 MerR family transcriptional regulator [Pseudoalteromonas sp. APC 4017]
MYISEMAKRSGASIKAVRHYEEIGLLTNIARQGRYRVYTKADVEFVTLIKRAQLLGLSLSQLKQLKVARHELDWPAVLALLEDKQQQVLNDIAALKKQKELLDFYHIDIKNCLNNLDSTP